MNKKITRELIKEANFTPKAIGVTAKMWIMPNGKVFSTGGNWHYHWALKNREMLEEKYGISFKGLSAKSEEDDVRLQLIKQGMFRLNYEGRSGNVTIEGLKKYFNRRVKDSILMMSMDNPDNFAGLRITLFDNTVSKVLKQNSASLFRYDGKEKTDKIMDLLNESSLSRIWDKTQDNTCGAITAFRGEFTRKENITRNRKLLAFILDRGYSVTKVKGAYIENFGTDDANEVGEESYFVCSKDGEQLIKDLLQLGKAFDQDSVLIIPEGGEDAYLQGTSHRDNAFPSYGETVTVGDAKFGKVAGEFFSRIRGRQFAFENIEKPNSISGKMAMNMYVEDVIKMF